MGDLHKVIDTKTWPEAWARIRRQIWNRQRRARPGCWDYRLQTLATRSRADIWRPVLARLPDRSPCPRAVSFGFN